MSLKAKIEAVIYAAEEPVTPAQLLSLFGEEAGAELDVRRAAQGELALGEAEPEERGIARGMDADSLDAEAASALGLDCGCSGG